MWSVCGVCVHVCAHVCACMNVQDPPVRITVRKRADDSADPSVRTEAPSPTSFQKSQTQVSIPSTGMLGRRNPLPSIHLGPSHDSHTAWAWVQPEKVKPHVKVDPRLEADSRMAQGRVQRLRRSSKARRNIPAGRSLLGLCSRVRVFTKKGMRNFFF